jgi:hypothetical protein
LGGGAGAKGDMIFGLRKRHSERGKNIIFLGGGEYR